MNRRGNQPESKILTHVFCFSLEISNPCLPGTTSGSGAAACDPCPPGHECGSGSAIACADGEFATRGHINCIECPAGYACPNKSSDILIECLPGTYAIAKQTKCTECPAGRFEISNNLFVEGSKKLGIDEMCILNEEIFEIFSFAKVEKNVTD